MGVLGEFDENRFRRWWTNAIERTRQVPQTDAEILGQLVLESGGWVWWMTCFGYCAGDVRMFDRHYWPAVSLIGYIDRWLYDLIQITPAEKWDSLVDLASQLYPSGPDQNGLWERAGGEDADLRWGGNEGARWREALRHIRRGGRPCIETLLREMKKDYVANTDVSFLADDREFGGYR